MFHGIFGCFSTKNGYQYNTKKDSRTLGCRAPPGSCKSIFKVAWSLRNRAVCDKFGPVGDSNDQIISNLTTLEPVENK